MRIFAAIFLLLLVSCTGKDDVPAGILPPVKFEKVLWDMLHAEELAQHEFVKDSTIAVFHRHSALYDQVFELHDIGKDHFRKSFNYYQGRPDLLKPILQRLFARSERELAESQKTN